MSFGGRRPRGACVIAVVLAAAVLGACGGNGDADKAPPGSASNPLPALPNPTKTRTPPQPDPDVGTSRPADAAKADAAKTAGESLASQQKAEQRAATKRRAEAAAKAKRAKAAAAKRSRGQRTLPLTTPVSARRPCTLVSKATAQALIGAPILQPLEAPQGPTCIYRTASGSRFVTVAVQTVDFQKLRKQLTQRQRVNVANRTGYCGKLGRSVLYVPLSAGRVLSVAAPCGLASRFAAKAVPRLPAA